MIEEKIAEVIDKLVDLGERLGTPAFDAVVRGVQLEGTISLVIGVVSFVVGALCAVTFAKSFYLCNEYETDNEPVKFGFALALAAASAILGVITFFVVPVILLDTSNWVAMIDPVAELARRIVQ